MPSLGTILDAGSAAARAALSRLKTLRQKLLDLSTRNRLISFKHSAKGSKSFVRIVDSSINDLFEYLTSGKTFEMVPLPHPPDEPPDEQNPAFLDALGEALLTDKKYLKDIEQIQAEERDDSENKTRLAQRELKDRIRKKLKMPTREEAMLTASEWAREKNINPEFELSENRNARRISQWQTLLSEEELTRRLNSIYRSSREAQNEYGVNTLYCVFGFLEWSPKTPAGEAEEVIFSPILLCPIDVRPKQRRRNLVNGRLLLDAGDQESLRPSKEEFMFSAEDSDEPYVNLALIERLREDHRINIPDWNEENPNLEVFFEQLRGAIAGHPKWSVRRFATITPLSFSRYPMWLDLDPDASSIPPHLHPIVGELLGGKEAEPSQGDNEKSDELIRSEDGIPFVLDIDLSQYIAIKKALEGKNLVIQGPPGTGKSQTIANLIAAALEQGKTVLFVAEKQVALEVVFKRLAEVGLGEFILQLHSAKGGKQDVLKSLKDRLGVKSSEFDDERDKEKRKNVAKLGEKLNDYAKAINSSFGAIQKTIHDIVWDEISLKNIPIPEGLRVFHFEDIEFWTQEQWDERKNVISEWENITKLVKSERIVERWGWVEAEGLLIYDQEEILNILALASEQAKNLEEIAQETSILCEPSSFISIEKTINSIVNLGQRPLLRKGMWDFAKQDNAFEEAESFYDALSSMQQEAAWLQGELPNFAVNLDLSKKRLLRLEALLKTNLIFQQLSTFKQLTDEKEASYYARRALPQALELLQGICQEVSTSDMGDLSEALSIAGKFFELSSQTPKELVNSNTKLESPESVNLLTDVISVISSAQKKWFEISPMLFSDCNIIPLSKLEEAASELSLGGFLAYFRRPAYRNAYRAAKKLFGAKQKKNWPELLANLAECRSVIEKLDTHPAKDILGFLYNNLNTDIELLQRILKWTEAVENILIPKNAFQVEIRKKLYAANEADLKNSNNVVRQNWVEPFQQLPGFVQKYDLTFLNHEDKLKVHFENIEEAIAICRELGLKLLIGEQFIEKCLKHLSSFIKSENYISSKPDLRRLLLPDSIQSRNEFEEAKRWINILKESGIKPEEIEKLTSDLGGESWKKVENLNQSLSHPLAALDQSFKTIQDLCAQTDRHMAAWKTMRLSELSVLLREKSNDLEGLLVRCRMLANHSKIRSLGLNSFIVGIINKKNTTHEDAGAVFQRLAVRSLCQKALKSNLVLQEFLKVGPEELQKRFKEMEIQISRLNIKKTIFKLLQRNVPRGNAAGLVKEKTEKGLIDYMVGQEKPRTPLRELMKRSGAALQALKPCFMMSPLSVAQLIEREKISFDMVIFDEASQIRPEDSISSLLRGRQFVIVGDREQLPPTNFGVKSYSGTSGEEEDPEGDLNVEESILEVAANSYGNGPMLQRHYRSRDPALIRFSNREFYGDKLEIFPSPFKSNPHTGIKFIKVKGTYANRSNLIEARKTASEVVEYMKNYPERSIGVVATNLPQKEMIQFELDRLVAKDFAANEYVRKWANTLEPLFVKNLESVQGDERDTIFISTVFGIDEDGNFFQRFGPINSAAGHRRLNVLFTRAKYQVVLISSIPIEQIQLGRQEGGTVHRGVSVLRKYLEYASSGQLASEAIITTRGYDSPFEQAVASELKKMGFDCIPQVGVKGFFIDLAVCHPENPHQFILGIECDGATYHSSRVARDRDRLRQEILEKLGWKLHRIWSTDWYADQGRQLVKLQERITRALSEKMSLTYSQNPIQGHQS